MHKTKTGRWQPDPPPKPEPEPEHLAHDMSYESYLIHRYCHILCDLHPDCYWCVGCAICRALEEGNPFAVLDKVTLR